MLVVIAEVEQPVWSGVTLARESGHAQELELSVCVAGGCTRSSHLSVLFGDVAQLDCLDS